MSATALKVVSTEPAAPPGRQNLIRALAQREETLRVYQTASAAVDRLRFLIEGETKAKAALAEIERKSAECASAWARGDISTLDVAPEAEIDAARREVARAGRLADAARGAMAGLNAEASAAAAAHSASIGDVTGAIHGALYAEAASIRARQLEHEAVAARCGEELISLVLAFGANPLPDDRRGSAVANYRQSINPAVDPLRDRAEPRSLAPRPELAAKYIDFAARLARDPAATLA
jgi:hypothetical protein